MPNTGYHRFQLSASSSTPTPMPELDDSQERLLLLYTERSAELKPEGCCVPALELLQSGGGCDVRVRPEGMFSAHLKQVKKMGTLGSVAWSPQQRTVADMFSKR